MEFPIRCLSCHGTRTEELERHESGTDGHITAIDTRHRCLDCGTEFRMAERHCPIARPKLVKPPT